MTRLTFRAIAACAAALFPFGCSKSQPQLVPFEGTVLLNGQPLPNALVQFIPMAEGMGFESVASATTDEKGQFQLTCKGQPGACVGENRITIQEAPFPSEIRRKQAEEAKYTASLKNRPIPEKYGKAAQTPLTVSVTVAQSDYKLELKR